ncbi:MAG: hypothetical protein HY537_11370 [Deltaproteobacteria bacterium]|nr:hypothetical protein [Deltaproteobacteria bacterium]
MKIFLDANVLFTAAHNPKGKASFLMSIAEAQKWTVLICALAIEEATRNLDMKFPSCLSGFKKFLRGIHVVPTVLGGDCPIALPEKDRPIFLSAVHAKCSHLLTGDLRDFGRYMNQPKKSGGILIQTVADFLASL